ncbi:MAG TPA: hypothetical protein VL492_02985 [Methylovirgula sp.]|nr:hypothetical protein [Methylovirgula sp.]
MKLDRASLRQIGLASTALSAILYVAAPAFADGVNFLSPVTNFVTAPFNHNKTNDDPNDIDYRPRPTLVVPPTNDLPPPHAVSTRAADWPKSPDADAARRARADSRRPAPSNDSMLDGRPPTGPDASPAQTANGQKCTVQFGVPICMGSALADASSGFNLFGGGGGGGLFGSGGGDAADVHLSANPGRQYLSDPPVSYMAPAPISEEAQKEANKEVAKSQEKPMWCVVPGMLGCTPAKGEIVHVPGSNETAAASPAQGGAAMAPAAPAQPAAPPAPKNCMFGGFSGCSN